MRDVRACLHLSSFTRLTASLGGAWSSATEQPPLSGRRCLSASVSGNGAAFPRGWSILVYILRKHKVRSLHTFRESLSGERFANSSAGAKPLRMRAAPFIRSRKMIREKFKESLLNFHY